jgi:predicted dehydrogenase
MFRYGVLGVSRFALKKMIPAMQRAGGVTVLAIASRDRGRAEEAARELGIPKAYGSYEELLADPSVDGIYNPLPNHLHVPWSERAAAAGKHVLCEKPIGCTALEASRLLAARDRHKVLIAEAAMVRMHPRWLAVRSLLREGRIGALRSFVGTFAYRLNDRSNVRYDRSMGGGVLLDTGFYPVTMSRFAFEAEPLRVTARMEKDKETGVDVLTSAILEFPQGHAVFTCGMELAPGQSAQLYGTGGHLWLGNAWTPPGDRRSELLVESSGELERPTAEWLTFAPVDQYTVLAEAFARAAERGGPAPIPLEDSLANMAVLDALARAAESGGSEQPRNDGLLPGSG